jgi:hypothetical protein
MHLKEIDKENLYLLLMKEDVKMRYERNNLPVPSDIKYSEESGQVCAGYHEVKSFMSKEPDLQLRGKESGDVLTIAWEQVIHKHVRTSDNVDIGYVDKVGKEFFVVREGVTNIHL